MPTLNDKNNELIRTDIVMRKLCNLKCVSIFFKLYLVLLEVNKVDTIIIFVFICGHLLYVLWCNYAGQELINYSTEVHYHT